MRQTTRRAMMGLLALKTVCLPFQVGWCGGGLRRPCRWRSGSRVSWLSAGWDWRIPGRRIAPCAEEGVAAVSREGDADAVAGFHFVADFDGLAQSFCIRIYRGVAWRGRPEPRTAQAVILMMALRGYWISGSGAVLEPMLPLPCHARAFKSTLSGHGRRMSREGAAFTTTRLGRV